MRGSPPWTDSTLILLRHGESEWNASNLFTGWVDVDLTEKGRAEAVRAGELIKELDRQPDVLYTSLLRRAITTANLALDKADRHWIPVHRDWRLNERHYGALQGLNKAETKEKYGDEQFMEWRRSYDTPPPPIEPGSEYSQDGDPRYADIDGGPLTECLKDVVERFVPYYDRDDRARPARRQDRPDRRARQLAARAGEVPRRHVGRGRRRAEHPDGHPASLRPGRRPQADGHRRRPTWTPKRRPRARPRLLRRARSRTREPAPSGERSAIRLTLGKPGFRTSCDWPCDMSRFGRTLLG